MTYQILFSGKNKKKKKNFNMLSAENVTQSAKNVKTFQKYHNNPKYWTP